MTKILIKNGRVFDGEGFLKADLFIADGIIKKIEPSITEKADFTFDAEGKTVSAGLVDSHIHIKGISSNDFGINAEMACLPFGVTAAADASGVMGDRQFLERLGIKNKVFVVAKIRDNKANLSSAGKMLEIYGDKAIGIKVYFDTSMTKVTTAEPLKEIVSFAEKRNLKVMVHSSNSPVPMAEIVNTLRSGDILTHAFHGGKNNASEDGFSSLIEAKKKGVLVDAGFAGHIHTDFGVLEEAIKSGAQPDVISTDITSCSAYKRGGRYGMTMCMSIAKSLGMTEEDIFKSVTITPAEAIGVSNECGRLLVGRKADVTVLDFTDEGFLLTDKAGNKVKSTVGYRCILTILDGEIVYRR